MDIGEDLVGAYLRMVEGCNLVAFNTNMETGQGEIDVIGLQIRSGETAAVWICEVSTHTSGLGGYKGQPVAKLRTKLTTARTYALDAYPDADLHLEFWSPKVGNRHAQGLADLEQEFGVKLVINDLYADRVRALAEKARATTAFSDHPSFRTLQILGCLSADPEVWQAPKLRQGRHTSSRSPVRRSVDRRIKRLRVYRLHPRLCLSPTPISINHVPHNNT